MEIVLTTFRHLGRDQLRTTSFRQALLHRVDISIHASEIDDTTVNRGGAEYRTD